MCGQSRHCLWENMVRIKIRVMAVIAITGPPAGIDKELGQVGDRCPILLRLTPVAVLPIRVRNAFRFAGGAPLETRYALRNR